MVIAVTGGAGFIGSHLCESLVNKDLEVVAIDNLDDFYNVEAKEKNVSLLRNTRRFHYYKANILDKPALVNIFQSHDIQQVFHLAGRGGVSQSVKTPAFYLENIVAGTLAVLEVCRERDVRRFVNASTSSVYGLGLEIPSAGAKFRESDRPTAPYAAFKKSAELLVHTYHHLYGIMGLNVRLHSVYGPRGRPDQVVHKFTNAVMQGRQIEWYEPEPWRDFTYVSDIVAALIATLDVADDHYDVFDLGYGKPYPISKVIEFIESSLGMNANVSKISTQPPRSDFPSSHADIETAKNLLSWEPKVGLEEGISNFVGWYKHFRS
jgi:UDP-glucuronate 4-epimerase